jgi:photosystem II stability/assembly factor-like uncharacterized protein
MKKALTLLTLILTLSINVHAQWEKMGGLYGESYGLAADGNKLVAYINEDRSGSISLDTGRTWIKMNRQTLIQSATLGFYIQGNNIFGMQQTGVTLSKDNGVTWSLINIPDPNAQNVMMVIDGTDTYLVASIYRTAQTFGVYKYNSALNKWDIQNYFPENTLSFSFSPNKIFAMTPIGFYVTNRNAISWVKTNLPFTPTIGFGFDIAKITASDNAVIAHTNDIVAYSSKDDGRTWKTLPSTDGRVYQLAMYKAGKFYFKKSGIIWVSTDTTASWRVLDNGWNNDARAGVLYRDMVMMGNTLIASTQSISNTLRGTGIMRMDLTSEKWTYLPQSPLEYSDILTINRSGTNLIASTYYGLLYSSTDNGKNWLPFGKLPFKTPDDAATSKSLITKDSFIFFFGSLHPFIGIGSDSTYMVRSSDYGKTWKKDNTMKEFRSYSFQGDTLFLTNFDGVFKSVRPYTVFTQISSIPMPYSFVIKDHIIVGIAGNDSIIRMNKNGVILPKSQFLKPYLYNLTVHNSRIIAHTLDSIYLSNDNGVTWFSKKILGTQNSLAYLESFNNVLLAIDEIKRVFISKDNGDTWSESSTGLTTGNYNSRSVKNGHLVDNGFVYIVFKELGIFRRAISDFGTNSIIENTINMLNLEIVPNPSSGDISFKLPSVVNTSNALLNITISDANGRVVFNKEKLFETNNSINNLNFSNGLYFLKVQIGHQYFVGKILINK